MTAFDRYRRPLTPSEQDRYLAEQAPIGLMAGADAVPTSVAELTDFVEAMRPAMAFTEQTHEFIRFLEGDTEHYDVPKREVWERRMGIRASMGLMPSWARILTGTQQPAWVDRLYLRPADQLKATVGRWVYPAPPCKEMALRRVGRVSAGSAVAA
jgi:uncharacterized protein (DUF2236 family)